MPCTYCNSTKSPNPDGSCPDCGRIVSQNNPSAPIDENQQYPVQHWRCTWLLVLFNLINAALIGGVLSACVWALYHFTDNESLNQWKDVFWIAAAAIPSVYFLLGFVFFLYRWFIKRYELRPKEIRLVKGFLNLSTNSTLLEVLWGMKLRQNFLQMIFGTGRITLLSDDITSPVHHINDIGRVRKRFNDLIRYQDYALDCSNVKVEKEVRIDTSVQVWKYSWRDLIDETIFGVLIPVALFLLIWLVPVLLSRFNLSVPQVSFKHNLIFTSIVAALYWCWLIWTFVDKICFTSYTLNNATLVKESGIFHKRIDVYVLCHIDDCEMSQNLWQRIVGDIGNIILYLKWENPNGANGESGSYSTTMKAVLHGLQNHTDKYETFKERWLRERHRRGAQ